MQEKQRLIFLPLLFAAFVLEMRVKVPPLFTQETVVS
jgi:hypothetical protein